MRRVAAAAVVIALTTTLAAAAAATHGADGPQFTIAFVRDGHLAFMRDDGSDPRLMASQAWGYPVWAPDGSRIAFPGPAGRLYVATPGGRTRRITRAPYSCAWLDWSPNGKRIAYTYNDDCGGYLDIRAINRDGTKPKWLTRNEGSFDPVWSRDGKSILFGAFRRASPIGTRLFVMRADGRARRMLPDTQLIEPQGSPSRPMAQWSGDGTHVLYVGYVPGHEQPTLVFADADGTNQRDLTPALNRVFRFVLSPDGTKIAVSADDTRRRDIYVLNADGSGLQKLTEMRGVLNDDPQWSPDASKLAYTQRIGFRGNDQIFVMNVDGSAQTNISNSTTVDFAPMWRPNGHSTP